MLVAPCNGVERHAEARYRGSWYAKAFGLEYRKVDLTEAAAADQARLGGPHQAPARGPDTRHGHVQPGDR